MNIIINIPAYNEEKTLASVIHSLPKSIDHHSVKVQVIDDGSEDETSVIARGFDHITLVGHDYNRGVWVTFKTATESFLASGGDIMINIDADGQFDPGDIPSLIAPIIEHRADIVIGSRFSGKDAKNMPWIKSFLNRLIAQVVGFLMMRKIDDLTCGFRAYSRESLLKLNLSTSYTYTQETIIDGFGKNLRIMWVPVSVKYFDGRRSRVVTTIFSYILRSCMIIFRTVRDVKPLVFFGLPGVLAMTLGIILFLVFLYFYLQTFQTTPYRTWLIVSGVSFLTGLLFLIFAAIADMIRRHGKVNEEILYMLKREYYSPSKK